MPEPLDETSTQVAARLDEAKELLGETERILNEETTAQHRSQWPNVYRLESATKHAQKAVALANPRITRDEAASALVSAAREVRDAIRAAVDSGGGNLIGTANDLLSATAQLEPLLVSEEAEAAGVTARKKLNDAEEELVNAKARIAQLINEADSKFAEAEAKRAERFEDSLHRTDADFSQARTAFDTRAQEAQDHIAELEEDISKTASEIGGQVIAIDNNKESIEQARLAFRWTVFTILILVFAAALSVAIGIENARQSPESVAGKITVALIVAGIASYAAGLARHHRQRAATARRLTIELNAFGPFIAPLEKVDRDDLRSTIVWRFFGPPDSVHQDSDAEPTPGPRLLQILKERREARGVASKDVTSQL